MCQPCLHPGAMEEDNNDNNLHDDDDNNLAFGADEDRANGDNIPDQQQQLMLQFWEYSEHARRKFLPLTQKEITAIKCLSVASN